MCCYRRRVHRQLFSEDSAVYFCKKMRCHFTVIKPLAVNQLFAKTWRHADVHKYHSATGFRGELPMSEVSSLPNCSFAQHPKKPATIHYSAQWVFMDAAYFLKPDLQDFAELLHLGIQKLEELKGLETDDFQRDWSEGTASFSVLFVQSVLFFCLCCLFCLLSSLYSISSDCSRLFCSFFWLF